MKTKTEHSLSERLSSLASAAQAVAAGDLLVRVPDMGDDNLGKVGQAFNEMTEQLQATINTLEDMVAQRTADLTESEERLRLLIEGVKDYAVIMLDPEGRVASWNTSAEAITGYAEHLVFGLPVSIFYPDEEVEGARVDWSLEMARESGRFEEEGWRIRKDGTQFWAEVLIFAIRDDLGDLRGFSHVLRDITEKNRIEQANRLLLETTRAVSAARDYDAALTGAVHSICKTTGWTFGEAWIPSNDERLECALAWHQGSPSLAAFHDDAHQTGLGPGECLVGDAWQSGKARWVEDVANAGGNCPRRELALAAGIQSAYAVPVVADHKTMAVLAFYNDGHQHDQDLADLVSSVVQQLGAVMRQRQADDEVKALNETLEAKVQERTIALEESNRELEDFTYVVSHDLKEPLRGIEGFSAFLAEDYASALDDEGRRFLSNIRDSAVRMKSLIENLLELSRLGRVHEDRSEINIGQAIEDVRRNLDFSIREKQIELLVRPGFPTIEAQAVRLKEVFQNLISNAVKFSKTDGGVVEVGWHKCDGEYVFFVRDNGIGIDQAYHERVFQIFQRLNRQEEYQGTGAGLTICKKIIESHGGRIWLESELGEGTTFSFSIPATPSQERDTHAGNE